MAADRTLARYARLAVEVGLNVQPGQRVMVGCAVEHAPLARAVADEAYRAGARFVEVLYTDRFVRRAHIEHAPEDALGWSPPWLVQAVADLIADGGAYLSVGGDPHPELLADLDGDRVARARMRELAEVRLRLSQGGCTWSVVAYPTEGWATTVFGEPDLERLWSAVATAVRLDEPDPAAAWRAHLAELAVRAARLNARGFDALRFRGPGTDLTIGLLPVSTWIGGASEARGITFVPNMPTEEVFTVPDADRVAGTVSVTYPLELEGTIVRGLRVRFEGGRAVEVRADSGEELARAHLATDEGAGRLGEVALVDRRSRVAETGVVFSNTLFDENASSHIAFGDAYFLGEEEMRALERAGGRAGAVNASSIHTDVMIGSPGLAVDGLGRDGEEVPILRGGEFVLP